MMCQSLRAPDMQACRLSTRLSFSYLGNPFGFQGRPHFPIDTQADATEGELMLNDHRARMNDPVIGRWVTRHPLSYMEFTPRSRVSRMFPRLITSSRSRHPLALEKSRSAAYEFLVSSPTQFSDPSGLHPCSGECTFTDKNVTASITNIWVCCGNRAPSGKEYH